MNTLKINVCYWASMSDGCSSQFKSRYCIAHLMNSCSKFKLTQGGFHRYASHGGKNTSDTIDSIAKSALKRVCLNTLTLKFTVMMQLSI